MRSAEEVPGPGPAPLLGVGDGEEYERTILEVVCDHAVASLERVISPALADFLA